MFFQRRPGLTQVLSRLGFITLLGLALFQTIDQEFPTDVLSARVGTFHQNWQDLRAKWGHEAQEGDYARTPGLEIFCQNSVQKKAVYCVRTQPISPASPKIMRSDTFLVAQLPLSQACPQTVSELPKYTQEILNQISEQ